MTGMLRCCIAISACDLISVLSQSIILVLPESRQFWPLMLLFARMQSRPRFCPSSWKRLRGRYQVWAELLQGLARQMRSLG